MPQLHTTTARLRAVSRQWKQPDTTRCFQLHSRACCSNSQPEGCCSQQPAALRVSETGPLILIRHVYPVWPCLLPAQLSLAGSLALQTSPHACKCHKISSDGQQMPVFSSSHTHPTSLNRLATTQLQHACKTDYAVHSALPRVVLSISCKNTQS